MEHDLLHQLTETAGIVGALTIVALVFVWREWRREAALKDALYETYVSKLTAVVHDYHEFAHALDRYVERHQEKDTKGKHGEA